MANSNVFVAWGYVNLSTIAHDVMQRFSNTSGKVPDVWDDEDFDPVYVVTSDRKPDGSAAHFAHPCEGLGDGGRARPLPSGSHEPSIDCPGPAEDRPAVDQP